MALGWCVGGLIGVMIGIAFGTFVARRHSWCPACGFSLRCTECPGTPTYSEALERWSPGHPSSRSPDVRHLSSREFALRERGGRL